MIASILALSTWLTRRFLAITSKSWYLNGILRHCFDAFNASILVGSMHPYPFQDQRQQMQTSILSACLINDRSELLSNQNRQVQKSSSPRFVITGSVAEDEHRNHSLELLLRGVLHLQ